MWKWLKSLFAGETYEESVARQKASGKLDLIYDGHSVRVKDVRLMMELRKPMVDELYEFVQSQMEVRRQNKRLTLKTLLKRSPNTFWDLVGREGLTEDVVAVLDEADREAEESGGSTTVEISPLINHQFDSIGSEEARDRLAEFDRWDAEQGKPARDSGMLGSGADSLRKRMKK